MFTSLGGSLLIMPLCYHPTTVLAVDDDIRFLKNLAVEISDKQVLLCFDKPQEVLKYTKDTHHLLPFTARCLKNKPDGVQFSALAIRDEIYNADRFKEIMITVTDYDMPHISGIALIKSMEFPPEITQYSHIILTGKISDTFKMRVKDLGEHGEYIGKQEPDYIHKLLTLIEKRSAKIFQWMSYIPARILSRNENEQNVFLFDGNFIKIFNKYVAENHVCELYLFDQQGSYLFLDAEANLSWFFIRNATGIENSIRLAQEYHAPASVIDKLKSKAFILSLYEKEDFEKRQHIDWQKHLLPAKIFETNDEYLSFFPNLIASAKVNDQKSSLPKYYYAFTKDFPDHGIDRSKILSYKQFLAENA